MAVFHPPRIRVFYQDLDPVSACLSRNPISSLARWPHHQLFSSLNLITLIKDSFDPLFSYFQIREKSRKILKKFLKIQRIKKRIFSNKKILKFYTFDTGWFQYTIDFVYTTLNESQICPIKYFTVLFVYLNIYIFIIIFISWLHE